MITSSTTSYLKPNITRSGYRDQRIIMYQILSRLKKERVMTTLAQQEEQEILREGWRRTGITKILFSCRITAVQFKNYMSYLMKTGLIEKKEAEYQRKKGKKLYNYVITGKGLRFVELIEQMKELFKDDTTYFIFPKNLNLE